jgi:hypothetical protein
MHLSKPGSKYTRNTGSDIIEKNENHLNERCEPKFFIKKTSSALFTKESNKMRELSPKKRKRGKKILMSPGIKQERTTSEIHSPHHRVSRLPAGFPYTTRLGRTDRMLPDNGGKQPRGTSPAFVCRPHNILASTRPFFLIVALGVSNSDRNSFGTS